jgi:hypothetical protein
LAASPANLTIEHTVRTSENSGWISVQNALDDELLATLSRTLGTKSITIYAIDEMVLHFSYRRFDQGNLVRALEYGDDGQPNDRGEWTRVEGAPEPWEALLFSPKLMALYRKYAPDQVQGDPDENAIKPGLSIPWACDAETIGEIASALELPWDPLGDGFPTATKTEVIPGSPERWKAFHRQHARPWWKFWLRSIR